MTPRCSLCNADISAEVAAARSEEARRAVSARHEALSPKERSAIATKASRANQRRSKASKAKTARLQSIGAKAMWVRRRAKA
jgi:hypothetical protein